MFPLQNHIEVLNFNCFHYLFEISTNPREKNCFFFIHQENYVIATLIMKKKMKTQFFKVETKRERVTQNNNTRNQKSNKEEH